MTLDDIMDRREINTIYVVPEPMEPCFIDGIAFIHLMEWMELRQENMMHIVIGMESITFRSANIVPWHDEGLITRQMILQKLNTVWRRESWVRALTQDAERVRVAKINYLRNEFHK